MVGMAKNVPGTEGYESEAPELLERYESYDFEVIHRHVLPFLPSPPASVLDIGSGTGRDAAWLADRGYDVVAAEPTDAFREAAMRLHTSPRITWIDDSLPDLATVADMGQRFDLVMLSAVWMHLDEQTRREAMPVVASLVAPEGTLAMTLRHGTVPEGRLMYPVTSEETIRLAEKEGLTVLVDEAADSIQEYNRKAGVTWSLLVFGKVA